MLTKKNFRFLTKNCPCNVSGKTVIITGGNSGIGFETAQTMVYFGANIILACRDLSRGNEAREKLLKDYPNAFVAVEELNLASAKSIENFVYRLQERKTDVDVFVNNAGVFRKPNLLTEDGFELVQGTNYMGTFLLCELLLPYLRGLPHEVTLVNTVSLVQRFASIDYSNFFGEKKYGNMYIYKTSKLAVARYSYYLSKRESNVKVYMTHPGISITPIAFKAFGKVISTLGRAFSFLFNSPQKSALSLSYLLSHRKEVGVGGVVGPNALLQGWGYPKKNKTLAKVKVGGEELYDFTKKLWQEKGKLV